MEGLRGGSETLAEVTSAFETASQNELRRKIEAEVLAPYGLTSAEWVRDGFKHFGPEEFARVNAKIEETALGVQIVVAGFEPDHWPRIFSITGRGRRLSHEMYGFVTIGTGATVAEASLTSTYDEALDAVTLTYRVCEAKFLGEAAYGVGKKTCVVMLSPHGTPHDLLAPEQVEPIRKICEEERARPVPEAASEAIQKWRQKKWEADYSKRRLGG